jgi:hypothetical protein
MGSWTVWHDGAGAKVARPHARAHQPGCGRNAKEHLDPTRPGFFGGDFASQMHAVGA